MSKKSWVILDVVAICAYLGLIVSSAIYFLQTGKTFPVWSYFVLAIPFIVAIAICYGIRYYKRDKFYKQLKEKNFAVEKSYVWDKYVVCIDFTDKLIACNQLENPILPFDKISKFELVFNNRTTVHVLSEGHKCVRVRISFDLGEGKFYHLPMYENVVAMTDNDLPCYLTLERMENKRHSLSMMLELYRQLDWIRSHTPQPEATPEANS
jgi:hypothetical protein